MKIQFYPALTLYLCLDLSPYFTDVFIHTFQNVTKPCAFGSTIIWSAVNGKAQSNPTNVKGSMSKCV